MVYQLSKLPCYQICARYSIVTVCVPKKLTEMKEGEAQNSWNDTRSSTSSRQIWECYFHQRRSEGGSIYVTAANHVEVITAELPNVVVHSVSKPPSEQFVLPPLGHRSLPQIVIGEHNTIWGYDAKYNNGVAVVQWAVGQPKTHPRCETTEIILQCKLEERL